MSSGVRRTIAPTPTPSATIIMLIITDGSNSMRKAWKPSMRLWGNLIVAAGSGRVLSWKVGVRTLRRWKKT
ncbi:hypothetical protein ES703_74442 [subsurface metagenome]